MKINKSCKQLLKIIIESEPTVQGKAYDFFVIKGKCRLSEIEYIENLKYLSQIGAIEPIDANLHYFKLTNLGRHFREFVWMDAKEFLLKSVLIPIIVAILTTLSIDMLKWLLGS